MDLFGAVSRLPGVIRNADNEVTGHITLSMASHVISLLLDEVITNFYQCHPRVTLSNNISESQEVIVRGYLSTCRK